MDQMPLGTEVSLGPGHFVLDGNLAPPRKWAQNPLPTFMVYGSLRPHKLHAHVYCGQTAGWIRAPLSTEVGLCSGGIVL